jgi:hypothetical protein
MNQRVNEAGARELLGSRGPTRRVVAASAFLACAACGDRDVVVTAVETEEGPAPATEQSSGTTAAEQSEGTTGSADPAPAPLYAVYTQVRTVDGRTNFLSLTDTLAAPAELDASKAMEVPGFSRFFAPEGGGFFAIGSGEDMTITRYDVTDTDQFEESGRVSFAGVGVTWMHYRAIFFGPTRAYYVDNTAAQIVVWNPQEMTVSKTFALPDVVVDGRDGYETFFPFYRFPIVGDRLFIPVSWVNREAGLARDVTGLIVVDTRTDAVLSYTETDRCPAATEIAFDDNGDVYFGTDYYYPMYSAAVRGSTRPGCVLRILAGEDAFDADYMLSLAQVTGNRATLSLTDGPVPGVAYVSVLDEARLPWSEFAAEPRFDEAWEWWRLDLASGEATVDTNMPVGGPGVSSHPLGLERFVVQSLADQSRSQLFKLSPDGEHEPGFSAPGLITGLARVR